MSKKIIILTVVLLLLFLGVYFGSRSGSNVVNKENNVIQISKNSTKSQVVLDLVKLSNPGFVVIREVVGGRLGQILEVSPYLTSGEHEQVVIDVPEITKENIDIIAILYKDNGDQGFNPILDTLVIENNAPVAYSALTGEVISMSVFSPIKSARNRDGEQITVIYNGSEYIPNTVNISVGDTVIFKNESEDGLMWTASDPHPAHTDLSTFDQFGVIKSGEEYRYTFTEAGRWGFHNHVNPTAVGVVVVSEK